MLVKSSTPAISFDRLQSLSAELRTRSPQWADRLDNVKTEQDLGRLVCDLFNLSHALPSRREPSRKANSHSLHITHFIRTNLHRRLTIKVLAKVLGHSEKYCSELFYRVMGESFSAYIRRQRVERASSLLTSTGQSLVDVAAAL